MTLKEAINTIGTASFEIAELTTGPKQLSQDDPAVIAQKSILVVANRRIVAILNEHYGKRLAVIDDDQTHVAIFRLSSDAQYGWNSDRYMVAPI